MEKIQNYLKDAYVFAMVMEDEEICREFIERLFPDKKINALQFKERIESEVTMENALDTKGVRLDVLFRGETEWYDIEMQTVLNVNLPKRTRFYASSMDMKQLSKGQDYTELKTNYIIFICDFDYFGQDIPVYAFENRTEDGLKLDDKSYKIFLNTSCSIDKVPDNLKALFEMIRNGSTDYEDSLTDMINNKIEKLSVDKVVRMRMTLYEDMQAFKNASEKEKKEMGTQLAEKDSKLAEKDIQLAEMGNQLAEKDEIIRKLQEQLAQTK